MRTYSSREVIKMLQADGWYEVNVVGSHHQYKHPVKRAYNRKASRQGYSSSNAKTH